MNIERLLSGGEVEQLLDVKQRRAILKTMFEKGIIKKIGVAKNTRYVVNISK